MSNLIPIYPLCGRCFGKTECTAAIPNDESCSCWGCHETDASLLVKALPHPILGTPVDVIGHPHEEYQRKITNVPGIGRLLVKVLDEVKHIAKGAPMLDPRELDRWPTRLIAAGSVLRIEDRPAGLYLVTQIPEGHIVATLKACNERERDITNFKSKAMSRRPNNV